MNLSRIVSESIKKVLSERVSSRVFHFLPIAAMANIAENDAISFSSSNRPSDKELSKGYPYYLSLSRTPSSAVGYVRMRISSGAEAWRYCIARIEFDGDKLNADFKGGPVNYFNDKLMKPNKVKHDSVVYSIPDSDSLSITPKVMQRPEPSLKRGRPSAIQTQLNAMRPEIFRQIDRNQMHEYEDRIFSEYSGIDGVGEYIVRIDILIKINNSKYSNETKREALSQIGKVLSRYGSKVNIYTNEVAFNSMNIEGAIDKQKFITAYQKERYMPVDKNEFGQKYSDDMNTDFQKGIAPNALRDIGKILYCASYVEAYYTGNFTDLLFKRYQARIGLSQYSEYLNAGVDKLRADISKYGSGAIQNLTGTAFTKVEDALYGNKRQYFDYLMNLCTNVLKEVAYLTNDKELLTHPKHIAQVMTRIYNRKQAI